MTSLWDTNRVTHLVRQILQSHHPDPTYGTGRPFLTTYQLAIEFSDQFPQVAAILAQQTGGEGHGPYALTTYLARWLPDRIRHRGVTDIELRFLAPIHIAGIQLQSGQSIISTTTDQAGFNTTMFRYIGP
tara:strand:- start:838 stop:1227 length:390 start_codon:yes stop_codon:yes gene_type:complete